MAEETMSEPEPECVVHYKTRVATSGGQTPEQCVFLKADPCCAPMREAWKGRFVGFGDFEDRYIPPGGAPAVNIYSCNPYHDEMAIASCPFCGAPVRLVEDCRVQVVERHRTEQVVRTYSEEVPL